MKKLPEFTQPKGQVRDGFKNWEIYWMLFWIVVLIIIGWLKVFLKIDVFDQLNHLHKK